MLSCPACARELSADLTECPFCHVVLAKYEHRQHQQERGRAAQRGLFEASELLVDQVTPDGRFTVSDGDGKFLYWAREHSSFLEWTLSNSRPFSLRLEDAQTGDLAFTMNKPLRLWDEIIEVFDGFSAPIGVVEYKANVPVRKYTLRDAKGGVVFEITAAFWRPWSFPVTRSGAEVGEIRKRWGGLGKEVFTNRDALQLRFPLNATLNEKALLLAALFLIELIHFEDANVF